MLGLDNCDVFKDLPADFLDDPNLLLYEKTLAEADLSEFAQFEK